MKKKTSNIQIQFYGKKKYQNQNPGYMKDNFIIIIESHHIADIGDQDNVSCVK